MIQAWSTTRGHRCHYGSIWAPLHTIWARFGKFLAPFRCQVGAILGHLGARAGTGWAGGVSRSVKNLQPTPPCNARSRPATCSTLGAILFPKWILRCTCFVSVSLAFLLATNCNNRFCHFGMSSATTWPCLNRRPVWRLTNTRRGVSRGGPGGSGGKSGTSGGKSGINFFLATFSLKSN